MKIVFNNIFMNFWEHFLVRESQLLIVNFRVVSPYHRMKCLMCLTVMFKPFSFRELVPANESAHENDPVNVFTKVPDGIRNTNVNVSTLFLLSLSVPEFRTHVHAKEAN